MGSRLKKKKTPGLRALKKKAWSLLSQIVRLSYADEGGFCGCYTCNAPIHWKYEAQAGHAIGGRTGAVLFDPEILRPQCYACNAAHIGGGRYHIFMTKLVHERGWDWWQQKVIDAGRVKKYTRSDLEALIQDYKRKLAEIEAREEPIDDALRGT